MDEEIVDLGSVEVPISIVPTRPEEEPESYHDHVHEDPKSLRFDDAEGNTTIVRLDQIASIKIEPAPDATGYYMVARLIGTKEKHVLNYNSPDQDRDRAVSTAIEILKLASNAVH